jgi:F-box/leucine-rich repeat protein 2/20
MIVDNCPDLEFFDLSRCTKITDVGIRKVLLGCTKLNALNLSFTVVSGNAFVKLESLPVRSLGLAKCQRMTDDGLREVANSCTELASLDLSYSSVISDVGIGNALRCATPSST